MGSEPAAYLVVSERHRGRVAPATGFGPFGVPESPGMAPRISPAQVALALLVLAVVTLVVLTVLGRVNA
jgi:hypothetical protein